ncbi:MAG: helix-turn-helix domain-containing protein [Cyanobacteriota bacterium]|nr:helix-turn-helix domain-containing protein [Cyanobacteriota bacterium]
MPSQDESRKKTLSPQLLEVAQLLASGRSYKEAGEATGVPRSTIGRWAKLEAVKTEIESIRAEGLEAHRQVSREAATTSAEDLQQKLRESAKRQERLISQSYVFGDQAFALAGKMLTKASEIFSENRPIEAHEKLLITSLPHIMRSAADVLKSASDAEDKIYGLEELSKRLDDWAEIHAQWQNNRN